MSLQKKINDYKQQFLTKVPPEKVALKTQATQELTQSGILNGILKEGAQAPDFSLKDSAGSQVHLAELRQHSNVILTFYRGVW